MMLKQPKEQKVFADKLKRQKYFLEMWHKNPTALIREKKHTLRQEDCSIKRLFYLIK